MINFNIIVNWKTMVTNGEEISNAMIGNDVLMIGKFCYVKQYIRLVMIVKNIGTISYNN